MMEAEVKRDSCGVCAYPTRYPHICRGNKARDAASLIFAAWRGAGDRGMSKRQTMAETGLNEDWFEAGKAYIRIHASQQFGVDSDPYVHDPHAHAVYEADKCTRGDECNFIHQEHQHYEGGVYKLTVDDDAVVAYLIREWTIIADMLKRRVDMSLTPMERRYNGSATGRKVIGWAKEGIYTAVSHLRHAAGMLEDVDASVRQSNVASERALNAVNSTL